MKGKRISIFLRESDEWQRRPLYLEILRALASENVEYAFVIPTIAGFTRAKDMKTRVALMSVSGYRPLIIEFADSVENVERAIARIAEITVGKVLSSVDAEISHPTAQSP